MKKRIAFIVDSLDRVFPTGVLKGGGNLVSQKLILEFAKKEDIELHIFSGEANFIQIDGVFKFHILKSSPYINNHVFLTEIKELTNNKFDYVMFLNMLAPFESVLVQAFSSVYRYNNCNLFLSFILKFFYGQKKIEYSKSRFSAENKNFFVVSERLKDDCVQNMNVDEDKICVVYPGVEIIDFKKEKNEVFTFGIASGTGKNKGALDVIIAALFLRLTGAKFKIKAILSTPKKNKFLEFVASALCVKNNIEIMERQKEMKNFYSSIDCVLMPSLNETFGLITLEAAAFKVPSIMSSTIGATEIFTDKKNAIFFEKRKFPVFNLFLKMRKIIELSKNKKDFEELQNNAYMVAQKYTWKSFADKIYEKIIEEVK